mgnify:FL=1
MAATTHRTVLLQVNGSERPIYSDKTAANGNITPGALIELASATTVQPIATADKFNARMFAVETSHAPLVNTPNIDQAYASGDNVYFIYAQPGDLVYAIIDASQTVTVGSRLAASGVAGRLSVETTNVDGTIVGIAEEAVTTGAGATARCRVRIV